MKNNYISISTNTGKSVNRVNANVPRHGALHSWYFRNELLRANYKNVACRCDQKRPLGNNL